MLLIVCFVHVVDCVGEEACLFRPRFLDEHVLNLLLEVQNPRILDVAALQRRQNHLTSYQRRRELAVVVVVDDIAQEIGGSRAMLGGRLRCGGSRRHDVGSGSCASLWYWAGCPSDAA